MHDAKTEGNVILEPGAFKGIFPWNLKYQGNIFLKHYLSGKFLRES